MIIDAMSVYAAVTANHIKIPAEKGLLSHLQYVRELVDRGILQFLADALKLIVKEVCSIFSLKDLMNMSVKYLLNNFKFTLSGSDLEHVFINAPVP